ncbi:hypothetical protein J2S09_000156 [Bacillus fengqiuensis]|nr:hypothetical protein [Bacillus fengqiuensis]
MHDEYDETLLFIKELGRLMDDYEKCDDREAKDEIYKDILLLSDAILQIH